MPTAVHISNSVLGSGIACSRKGHENLSSRKIVAFAVFTPSFLKIACERDGDGQGNNKNSQNWFFQYDIFLLGYQFSILKRLGVHDALEHVVENVVVLVVIVSPLKLIEIATHVLDAHLVERPGEGTLEQRPDALYAVRMDIANNPFFLGVDHRFMARVMVGNPDIGFELVRINGLCLVLHGVLDVGGYARYEPCLRAGWPPLPTARLLCRVSEIQLFICSILILIQNLFLKNWRK